MAKFQLVVNVAGVQPFEPGFTRLPQGAYAVSIKDVDLKASQDPAKAASLQFDVVVAEEGEFKGVPARIYMGSDFTKDFNKKHMRALLLGMGANPAALDQGSLNVDESVFVGKTAFIYVETREGKDEQGRNLLDNRNFVAPEYYRKAKEEAAAKKAGATGATATGTQTAAPAAGAGMAGLAGALGGAPAPGATAGGALFGK